MTDEDIREAMVENFPEVYRRQLGRDDYNYFNSGVGRILPLIDGDPLKDLNAVHEVVKRLSPYELSEYRMNFLTKIASTSTYAMTRIEEAMDATARHRCEAILKSKNKWKY